MDCTSTVRVGVPRGCPAVGREGREGREGGRSGFVGLGIVRLVGLGVVYEQMGWEFFPGFGLLNGVEEGSSLIYGGGMEGGREGHLVLE